MLRNNAVSKGPSLYNNSGHTKATRRPLVKRGRATRRPHEGHTKATGKTCSFSACARQRVKNCLPSSKCLLWQLWFLKKHMFYQWPSCGLRVAFVGFPSGLRVAFVWPLTKAVNFKGPKCQVPSQGHRYHACCHRYHASSYTQHAVEVVCA